MKTAAQAIGLFWLVAIGMLTALGFFAGTADHDRFCTDLKMRRWEYLVPGRVIGCFLTGVPE